MADIDFAEVFAHIAFALIVVGVPLVLFIDDWMREKRRDSRPCRKVRDVRRAAADARLATYRKRLGPEEVPNG